MTLIDLAEPPRPAMLRWFGLSLGGLMLLVAIILGWQANSSAKWIAIFAIVFLLIYYLVPASQSSIVRTWQRFTYPITWAVGIALLSIIFYGVLTPLGLLLRLAGYDSMQLRSKPSESMWADRIDTPAKTHYFRQY